MPVEGLAAGRRRLSSHSERAIHASVHLDNADGQGSPKSARHYRRQESEDQWPQMFRAQEVIHEAATQLSDEKSKIRVPQRVASPVRRRNSGAFAPGALAPILTSQASSNSILSTTPTGTPKHLASGRGADEPTSSRANGSTHIASGPNSPESKTMRRGHSAPDSQHQGLPLQFNDVWRGIHDPLRTAPNIALPPHRTTSLGLQTTLEGEHEGERSAVDRLNSLDILDSPSSAVYSPATYGEGGHGPSRARRPSFDGRQGTEWRQSSSASLRPRPPGAAGLDRAESRKQTRARVAEYLAQLQEALQEGLDLDELGPAPPSRAPRRRSYIQAGPIVYRSMAPASAASPSAQSPTPGAFAPFTPLDIPTGTGAFVPFTHLDTPTGTSAGFTGGLVRSMSSASEADGGAMSTRASRPSSARQKPVSVLVEAVRCRDEAQLRMMLDYLRMPDGRIAGLNERHPVTGRTALHEAVELSLLGMATLLLDNGADPNMPHETQGPPLLRAAWAGELAMVELLLEHHADMELVDVERSTALHYACSYGHVETARLLIRRGANISARNIDERVPLDLARFDIVKAMFEASPSPTPASGSAASAASSNTSGLGSTTALGSASKWRTPPLSPSMRPPPPGSASGAGGISGAGSAGGGSGADAVRPSPPERPREESAGHPWVRSRHHMRPDDGDAGSSESPSASTATAKSEASEDIPPPPAPTPPLLQLPGKMLRKMRSRGATESDITEAYAEEDSDLIRLSRDGAADLPYMSSAATAAAATYFPPAPLPALPPSHFATRHGPAHHLFIQPAPPSTAGTPALPPQPPHRGSSGGSSAEAGLGPPPAHPSISARPRLSNGAIPAHVAHVVIAPAGSGSASAGPGSPAHIVVPMGPPRFAMDMFRSPSMRNSSSAAAAPVAAASPPNPAAFGAQQQSPAPQNPLQEVQRSASANASSGTSATAAAAAVAAPPAGPPLAGVNGSDQVDDGGLGSTPPPLIPDDSPPQSPRVAPASPSGVLRPSAMLMWQEGRCDPMRISQAAEALAARVVTASSEAINTRAALLFNKSVEVSTGDLQWTRGELLGEGAYGKVFAGLNHITGEIMAVKVLELPGRAGPAATQQLIELQRELDLLKTLSHRNIVGYIHSYFEPSFSTLYIFLEFVPGGSIASMVERFGKFSEDLVRNYTRQLLLGMEYLHRERVVHRDLKGGNVLVSRDGVVKIADFGASKAYRDQTGTDGMKSLRGSVFWMAPEVFRQKGYGRKADIWSLGCTVIEMLTGRHPWPDLDNQMSAIFHIAKTTEGPPRPPGISDMARSFLDWCLSIDAAKRPTASELLQHPFVCGPNVARRDEQHRPDLNHSF